MADPQSAVAAPSSSAASSPASVSLLKLPYEVVSCSSEDGRYPASALSPASASSSASLHGWQSARTCTYPQSLVLWFGCECEMRKLQLLSHQSRIARTVELFAGRQRSSGAAAAALGRKGSTEGIEWSRLGYFSLDSNEKSGYKARELKVSSTEQQLSGSRPSFLCSSRLPPSCSAVRCQSVPISCVGSHLKLQLKGCHANPHNPHQQVGIVALNVVGHHLHSASPAFSLPAAAASSLPSLSSSSSSPLSSLSPSPSLPPDLDLTTTQYLLHLSQLKAQAIDAEDYDAAKAMKARLDRLQQLLPLIAEAERRKREAIERDDFDMAKDCKREVERLRETALMGSGGQQPDDERKDDRRGGRGDASHHAHRVSHSRGHAQHQGDSLDAAAAASLPPARPALLDDERPIKPAKLAMQQQQQQHSVQGEPPTGQSRRQQQQELGAEEDSAFPVKRASPSPHDERPLRAARATQNGHGAAAGQDGAEQQGQRTAVEDDRPIRTKKSAAVSDHTEESALGSAAADFPVSSPSSPSSSSLPAAEPLLPVVRKEAEPIIEVLGMELTQQLFSRHWQLRAEAVAVVTTLLADAASPVRAGREAGGLSGLVALVGRVLLRAMGDKVAQVFVAGCRLLETLMREAGRGGAGGGGGVREEVRAMVEAVSRAMVDKLSSSVARERDQASQVLVFLAFHRQSPPAVVAAALLAPLKKREVEHPIPVRARLLVLHALLLRLGPAEAQGLSQAALLRFTLPALVHRDAAVRDAAANLVASLSLSSDRSKLESTLQSLPRSTLESLLQRMADVADGSIAFGEVEAPTRAYVERIAVGAGAGAGGGGGVVVISSNVSPRRAAAMRRERDREDGRGEAAEAAAAVKTELPLSARRDKAAASKKRDAAQPLSARSSGGDHHPAAVAVKKSPRDVRKEGAKRETTAAAGAQKRSEADGRRGGKKEAVHSRSDAREEEKQQTSRAANRSSGSSSAAVRKRRQDERHAAYAAEAEVEEEEEEEAAAASPHHLAAPNAGSPSHFQLKHARESEPASPLSPLSPSRPPPPAAAALRSSVPSDSSSSSQCQFCGVEDASFLSEDALDLHYWQSCAMLLSCAQCEQVVEIPTYGEHLLGECESRTVEWAACSRCNWVVEAAGVGEHEAECGGVKEGCAVCQLCCREVEATEEGWRRHLLLDGCSGNSRTQPQQETDNDSAAVR